MAGAVITGMEAVSGAIRRVRLPGETDRTRLLRLAARQVVAHDENVVALTFVAADGAPLPRWHPGAHIDVHLPSGLLRQYSLCGEPESQDSYRIAVRCIPDGGGGSIEMHEARDRRHRHHARSTQRIPADRPRLRLPHEGVSLRRGRHRHNADPADARTCRASRRRLVDGVRGPQPRQPAVHRGTSAGSAIESRSAPTT